MEIVREDYWKLMVVLLFSSWTHTLSRTLPTFVPVLHPTEISPSVPSSGGEHDNGLLVGPQWMLCYGEVIMAVQHDLPDVLFHPGPSTLHAHVPPYVLLFHSYRV